MKHAMKGGRSGGGSGGGRGISSSPLSALGFWRIILDDYVELFAGDAQVLSKFGSLIRHVDDPELKRWLKSMKKAKRVADLRKALDR